MQDNMLIYYNKYGKFKYKLKGYIVKIKQKHEDISFLTVTVLWFLMNLYGVNIFDVFMPGMEVQENIAKALGDRRDQAYRL